MSQVDLKLSGLRSAMLGLRAARSSGSVYDGKLREAIGFAVAEMATALPDQFASQRVTVATIPDVSSAAQSTYIQTTGDAWVMRFTTLGGAALGTRPSGWTPAIDGVWDGVMWLEVVRSDGTRVRIQTREWWRDLDDDDPTEYYVSLVRPWPGAPSESDMAFTIYQEQVWLPGRLIQARRPLRVYRPGVAHLLLSQVTEEKARRHGWGDLHQGSGQPSRWWKSGNFALQAPRQAPTPTLLNPVSYPWAGPVQEGKWKFYYTFVWGRADRYHGDSGRGVRDPVWESAPSDASAEVDQNAGGQGIAVQCSNIDALLNFGNPLDLRYGRTGLRIRIYAQRLDIDVGATPTAYDEVEATHPPYLLTEIEPTVTNARGNAAEFIWDGSVIPDPTRPLVRHHLYDGIQLDTRADQRYEIDIEAAFFPHALHDDSDALSLHTTGVAAFMHLCLAWMSLQDGPDFDAERTHRSRFEQAKREFRAARDGDVDVVEATPYGGGDRAPDGGFWPTIAPFTETS